MALPEKKFVSTVGSPFRVLDFGQVQVQIQIAEITDDSIRTHLAAETARLTGLIKGRDRVVPRKAVVIADGSCELIPKASVRKLQADWIKSNEEMLRLVVHGLGIIVPGMLVRNTVTAVLWLAPLPVPMKVLKDMDEALAWAIGEVDAYGGEVDTELRAGRRLAVEKYLSAARVSTKALDEQLAKRAQSRAAAGAG